MKSANILIANNPHVFEKRLFSELGYGEELKIITATNEEHEAERVVVDLIAHHFINKHSYTDYAILYRGNHQSRVFEKMLMQNRIHIVSLAVRRSSRVQKLKICWLISAC